MYPELVEVDWNPGLSSFRIPFPLRMIDIVVAQRDTGEGPV